MDEFFLSRREFVAGCAGGVAAAAGGTTGRAADPATIATADLLADYVAAHDPSTAVEPLGGGEMFGGRWRTSRLTSQTWKGVAWEHELSMFMPAEARAADRMILWIDGGSRKKVPQAQVVEPGESMRILAAVGNASAHIAFCAAWPVWVAVEAAAAAAEV